MSMTGHIPWNDYFQIQEQDDFVFTKEYKNNHIIYLYRNPLDVLFSYWPYLKSIPYKNFKFEKQNDFLNKEYFLSSVLGKNYANNNYLENLIDKLYN